jgi:pantoate--beta-alanine ligase
MRTLRTAAEVRAALAGPRREGRSIGFVATMGALHAGHVSLIERARAESDEVVVSLFVNPAQFDDPADLERYPRDEAADAAVAAEAGADLLFAPGAGDLYPDGFSTTVHVAGRVTEVLEGRERGSAHFDGVATVVAKLLNVVAPDATYFGQKDAQQLAVVRKLVRDLDLPVLVESSPIVRDADGLALSSRNALLADADRPRALALRRGLLAARSAAEAGERDAGVLVAAATAAMREAGVEPEYLAVVDPDTFEDVSPLAGDVLVAVAARVGGVRLIDNDLLTLGEP